jgi:LuxR family maltose regulon positive regulatory protein
VRTWCATRNLPFAWVTLDVGDNDPVQLWRYIATAVDRVRNGLGHAALRGLADAGAPIERPVDELMNGIATFGNELVIVLDDLETVTAHDCLASIDHAVAHLPAAARLILLTRTDPALALAGLRARGGLAEVHANDLAFTPAETHELLVERAGIALGAEEVELLQARTEGWPAALVLCALWLRSVANPKLAVREFRGSHRFVADYLSQEVLAALDDDVRSFLLRASVLGRFTAELCDVVFDRSDSASMLAELERSNLFTSPLEYGGWFRIHSLFAEFAEFHLASIEPVAAEEINRRAARWLRSRGLPLEAVKHAAAAGDHDLVAQILVESHQPLISRGSSRTFLRWVRTLPDQQVVDNPELALAAATAATFVGRGALERRRFLGLLDRAQAERPDRFSTAVEAGAAWLRTAVIEAGVGQAVLAGRRAVSIAQAGADEVLVAALSGCARALYFAGEPGEARAMAMHALEHPDAERRPPACASARATLALIAIDRGQLVSARAHAEKAKAIVASIGSSRSWLGAHAAAALGLVLAAEGSLAQAEQELAYAEHFYRDEVALLHHTWLLLALARIRSRRGRLDAGEEALRAARHELEALVDGGRLASLAAEVERELARARARAHSGEILERPSEAELAVLRLLGSELSVRQIGGELFLSPNTVRSHTRAIYRKLGVNARAEAVARAEALGLLAQSESPM